jgi:hypothetical protein
MSCVRKIDQLQLFYPDDIQMWAILETLSDESRLDKSVFLQLIELSVLSQHDEIVLTYSSGTSCFFVRALMSKYQAFHHTLDRLIENWGSYQELLTMIGEKPQEQTWKSVFTARVFCLLKSDTPEVKILKETCFINILKLGDIINATVMPCEVHTVRKRTLEPPSDPISKRQVHVVRVE